MRIDFAAALLIQAASASRTGWASLLIAYWSKSKKISPKPGPSPPANEDGALGGRLSILLLDDGGTSRGARAASSVDGRSSGIVAMLSGLMVSTGAAALFSFVVEVASPDDDATRFPEQPHRLPSIIRHSTVTDRVRGLTRFIIPHLSVWWMAHAPSCHRLAGD